MPPATSTTRSLGSGRTKMYHVFLDAPTASQLRSSEAERYSWKTITSDVTLQPDKSIQSLAPADLSALILPPATIEAASMRISKMYKNVIFEDDEPYSQEDELEDETGGVSWPATLPRELQSSTSHLSGILSKMSQKRAPLETQETQETQETSYSDGSSIGRFPTFSFSMHSLASLSTFTHPNIPTRRDLNGFAKSTSNFILAVFENEGVEMIRLKEGRDTGKQISMLNMILGDENSNMCKLTVWKELADNWGNIVKRGDIVFLENVTVTAGTSDSAPKISGSTYNRSRLQVCYRTMPYSPEDQQYRPDLRLGESDAAVRKVAKVVGWFERMAGL